MKSVYTLKLTTIGPARPLERPMPAEPEPAPAAPQPTAAARPRKRFAPTKAILMLLMAIGIAAYFGGAGTFAGFTAETSNPNDTPSSGTLTFTNQVNSLTACTSIGGASSNNINSGCSSLFALTNVAPGVFGGTAQITLQNTGTNATTSVKVAGPSAFLTLQGNNNGSLCRRPP